MMMPGKREPHINVQVKLPSFYDESNASAQVIITSDEQDTHTRVVDRLVMYRTGTHLEQHVHLRPSARAVLHKIPQMQQKVRENTVWFAPKPRKPVVPRNVTGGIPPVVRPITIEGSQIQRKRRIVTLRYGLNIQQDHTFSQSVYDNASEAAVPPLTPCDDQDSDSSYPSTSEAYEDANEDDLYVCKSGKLSSSFVKQGVVR